MHISPDFSFLRHLILDLELDKFGIQCNDVFQTLVILIKAANNSKQFYVQISMCFDFVCLFVYY